MTDELLERKALRANIALLLEGSYPYILGGVSSWVQQMIEGFPQYTFALIFLGGAPENYKEGIRYSIPANVTHFQRHYLFEEDSDPPLPDHSVIGDEKGFEALREMHALFSCQQAKSLAALGDVAGLMQCVDYKQFLYSKRSWDRIVEGYTAECEDASFIDFFWTIKNIHKPLWKIASICKQFPVVDVIHSVSTGYAGLLSYFLNKQLHIPVILTEHGIYTKERQIDIFLSSVFRDDPERPLTDASYLRTLWDRYFKTLAQLSYQVANPITSLFHHASVIQKEEGADFEKLKIIPNGIHIERFKVLRRPLEEKRPIVCFIGRIVPMKDVKGFIRAIPKLHQQMPLLTFWIVGSTDQDPAYAEECVALVENLFMQDVVEFIPHQRMEDVLPNIKVLVLSAIREGMPLVILESFAAGVPVVATDVGACRELILGMNEEDKALGAAGRIVKVAHTEMLEKAIIEVMTDSVLWNQMSQTAIKRAERFYDEKTMIQAYATIYEKEIP